MKNSYFFYGLIFFANWFCTKSPNEFIPTYGKQITLYHQVEDYFQSSYLTQTGFAQKYVFRT